MKKSLLGIALAAASALLIIRISAVSQSMSNEASLRHYLNQLYAMLDGNWGVNEEEKDLRSRIIKFVKSLKKAPKIPEEAMQHYVTAMTLFDNAKNENDFFEPITHFKSSALIAPWWPKPYKGLGLVYEASGRYDEAITALELYLETDPGTVIAEKVHEEIYKIEALKKVQQKDAQRNEHKFNTSADLKRISETWQAEADAMAGNFDYWDIQNNSVMRETNLGVKTPFTFLERDINGIITLFETSSLRGEPTKVWGNFFSGNRTKCEGGAWVNDADGKEISNYWIHAIVSQDGEFIKISYKGHQPIWASEGIYIRE